MSSKSRFEQSLTAACVLESFTDLDTTGVAVYHLAPFWTLMPKDLSIYYWFLYLPQFDEVPEYDLETWLSPSFRRLVNGAPMGENLSMYWHTVEEKLIKAGILSHAVATNENGEMVPCYHVHPICTLVTRGLLADQGWKGARYAFVRAAILWDPNINTHDWVKVKWDGTRRPHEDHFYNWRAVAMAWSVQDGNPLDEALRTGVTMFDLTYRLILVAPHLHPRHGHLILPSIRRHLQQVYMTVNLCRPNRIPTGHDLYAILTYTWDIWVIDSKLHLSSANVRAGIVQSALEVFQRWRTAKIQSGDEPLLSPPAEASYQQLLFAAAAAKREANNLERAKSLFLDHLTTDPVTSEPKMLNLIRRWQLQSLEGWAACVMELAIEDGTLGIKEIQQAWRCVIQQVEGSDKPGRLSKQFFQLIQQEIEVAAEQTYRDCFAFALEREPEAVERFGWLAREILDGNLYTVFGDISEPEDVISEAHPDGVVPQSSDLVGANGEEDTRKQVMVKKMAKLLAFVQEQTKNHGASNVKPAGLVVAQRTSESAMRVLAGDTTGAAAALQAEIKREALSSTAGTGWSQLANLHMAMYLLAVTMADKPDYEKGLTHLNELCKLQEGNAVAKREKCSVLIYFAVCHDGLGQVADAARSVIKLVQIGKTMSPDDLIDEDVSATHRWMYSAIFELEKLHIFLDPKVIFAFLRHASPGVAELWFTERALMHQIMTSAKEVHLESSQALGCSK
jgi:hypothetical protein